VIVVGGGVFGVEGARELKRRGYKVVIIETEVQKPNPLASSTDISKMIRSDYGDDEFYFQLHHEALKGWRSWNQQWGEELFHETGLLMLSKSKMEENPFVRDGYKMALKHGYKVEKFNNAQDIKKKFPQWNTQKDVYIQGYYNLHGGWAESGQVLNRLIKQAKEEGINFVQGRVKSILKETNGKKEKVVGVQLESGEELRAPHTIVAAGAWTSVLLPHLQKIMWPVAQQVFHFRSKSKQTMELYKDMPAYSADTSNTGFYGFPMHPHENCIKIGHHGMGYPLKGQVITSDSLEKLKDKIRPSEEMKFRTFLAETFPNLKDAEIVGSRICLYCDTFDGDFLIDHDPDTEGLFVASGGSGHGFKFSPVLGRVIADAFERKPNHFKSRFVWRKRDTDKVDAIRFNPTPVTKIQSAL